MQGAFRGQKIIYKKINCYESKQIFDISNSPYTYRYYIVLLSIYISRYTLRTDFYRG